MLFGVIFKTSLGVGITLCSQRCVYSQKVLTLSHAMSQIITKTWSKTHQFCSENYKNLKFLSISLYFSITGTKRTPMRNFSCKNIGFVSIMNEMGTILKPYIPFLYSKLLEACALFGFSYISCYIKLSLVVGSSMAEGSRLIVGSLLQPHREKMCQFTSN